MGKGISRRGMLGALLAAPAALKVAAAAPAAAPVVAPVLSPSRWAYVYGPAWAWVGPSGDMVITGDPDAPAPVGVLSVPSVLGRRR